MVKRTSSSKTSYILKNPTSKARMSNVTLRDGTIIQPVDKTIHERALIKVGQVYKGARHGNRKAKV